MGLGGKGRRRPPVKVITSDSNAVVFVIRISRRREWARRRMISIGGPRPWRPPDPLRGAESGTRRLGGLERLTTAKALHVICWMSLLMRKIRSSSAVCVPLREM